MLNQKYRLKFKTWQEFDHEENKSDEFSKIQNKLLKIGSFLLLQLKSLQYFNKFYNLSNLFKNF